MSLEDRLYPLLAIYERMPEGVQRAAGKAYRCLPARWRWGARYGEFKKLAAEAETWDPERIVEYQTRQLRQTLIHAGNYCPFYQRRFAEARFQPELLRSPEDLARCPFTTKEDLQRHRDELASRNIPPRQRLYITTGGSTGAPVGFHLQKGVSRPKEQAFLEAQWARAGYARSSRLAVIRGHVTTDRAAGPIARYDATRDWLMLSSYHLTEARLPEYLEALERFRPDILHAYPSAALQLAEYLERSGQSWRIPLRCILAGSERLNIPQKRLLERVFGCRVFRWYGHAERVVLAAEGRRSELFHFWPAYGFVEFGEPDAAGFCEVIGTTFHNLAMPLVRYRTGDYVRLADPRVDGDLEFPWPAVAEIAGREQEFLVSREGRRISLTAFNMHDDIFDGLYAVQFFQDTPGVAEFRYVPSPQFHASRLEAIRAGVQRKLGDDFTVVFREVRETERTARGKHRWLVSSLTGAAPASDPTPPPATDR
jgi:phenylacetate-CoA ligase